MYRHDRRGNVRVVSEEEMQALSREAETSLPEKLKRKYPVSSIEEIKKAFPNQWVALLYANPEYTAARLVAHAAERTDLEAELKSLQKKHPELKGIPSEFTGPYTFGGGLVIA